MELYQLKTFITVAQTSSVTRSAAHLNTTPPSVSNHIRQLEDHLGVTLFIRTSKGMTITSQGQSLLEKAQIILKNADEMQQLAQSMGSHVKGHVTLGINADSRFLRTTNIIQSVYKQHPSITLEIITSSTGDIIDAVKSGRMDCGFAFGDVSNQKLSITFLADVQLEIAIPVKHKAKFESASLAQLSQLPWIVPDNRCPFLETVKGHLDKKGIELAEKIVANDDVSKQAFIDNGVAVTVLEKAEAVRLAAQNKVLLWRGPQKFKSTLSFIRHKEQSNDLIVQIVQKSVLAAWNHSSNAQNNAPIN
jgi:DNA-binding transcriptional LysR family regulator